MTDFDNKLKEQTSAKSIIHQTGPSAVHPRPSNPLEATAAPPCLSNPLGATVVPLHLSNPLEATSNQMTKVIPTQIPPALSFSSMVSNPPVPVTANPSENFTDESKTTKTAEKKERSKFASAKHEADHFF